MHKEYEELDHEELDDPIAGRDDTAVEMNFYYMDLTSTAIARVYEGVWANYLVCIRPKTASSSNSNSSFAR